MAKKAIWSSLRTYCWYHVFIQSFSQCCFVTANIFFSNLKPVYFYSLSWIRIDIFILSPMVAGCLPHQSRVNSVYLPSRDFPGDLQHNMMSLSPSPVFSFSIKSFGNSVYPCRTSFGISCKSRNVSLPLFSSFFFSDCKGVQ